MCARYTLRTSPKILAEHLGVTDLPLFTARFNVAPTQSVLAVRQRETEREGVLFRWGLIPSWAKDAKIGVRCLNARADTVADKPAFRHAFKKRRCVIAADGFYEWTTVNGKKQPWHIRLAGGEPFGFAGLWEVWHAEDGEVIESCTIITTEPNEVLRPIHNRMPVILPKDHHEAWLTPTEDARQLLPLLRPFPAEKMEAAAANPYMNNSRNEGPACLKPIVF